MTPSSSDGQRANRWSGDWRDLDLLDIEMDLLWAARGGPDLVIACARDGTRMRIGSAVPGALAETLVADLESATLGTDLDAPPPVVERMQLRLQDAFGAAVGLARGSGPSFLIPDGVRSSTNARLVGSDASDTRALEVANPGNWQLDKWHDLLAGRLGAWVMGLVESRVVSICHMPVSNARAAEAGVWTHPDFRGQGYAAACTAEWASLMRADGGRLLFYSTSHSNRSSQRVAARLGLRPLGWLWQLSREAVISGWSDPRVRAAPSTIEGSGLRTSAPIPAGEVVLVWGDGRTISDAELATIERSGRRYSSAAIGENEHLLWDADQAGPGGVNHSCNPNLWMLDGRTLGARRDIAAGEELTLDYALVTVSPAWRMECHCGAAECRGGVTGNDWQLRRLQHVYAGHFSPFINARISASALRGETV